MATTNNEQERMLAIHADPKLIPGQPAPRSQVKRWVTALVTMLILGLGGALLWPVLTGNAEAQRPPRATGGNRPQVVAATTIGTASLDVTLTGLGAVTPLATVTVKTRIDGQLEKLGFSEGQIVHRGDFLAQIDPKPYEVALEQAQGNLAHDTGLLDQARMDSGRYQTLVKQDSIAKQQADDQAQLVKQYEGTVAADKATVNSAKLNLFYCRIVSPVDGRVGIRLVDEGNYVQTTDTTGLFVVTQIEPMSVIFTLPEDVVQDVQDQMHAGQIAVTAFNRADAQQIASGTLATTDNQIDSTTGTFKLRAMFPNTDHALFPQQFVNAHLLLKSIKDATVAPQPAIQQGEHGDFVYLIKPDNTVVAQPVKLGVTDHGKVQILSGLKPGDRVVTDGLDRLRGGAHVVVADGVLGRAASRDPAQGRPHDRPAPDAMPSKP